LLYKPIMSDLGVAVARALDRIGAIPSAVAGRTAAADRTVAVDRIALADRIAPAVPSVEALSVAPPGAMNAPVAGRFAQAVEDEALASRSLMAWRAVPSDLDAVSFRLLPVARVTIRGPAERVVSASARVCALGVRL
jgi:hypothetical protein